MMKKLLWTIVLMSIASSAWAWDWQPGPFTITRIQIGTYGFFVQLSPAPAHCNGGSYYGMHAIVSSSNAQYREFISELIAAFHSKTTIDGIWTEGNSCSNNETYLTLDMATFKTS